MDKVPDEEYFLNKFSKLSYLKSTDGKVSAVSAYADKTSKVTSGDRLPTLWETGAAGH